MSFSLPALPYALDALEPHMSSATLELHHGKHHRAYVSKLVELTKDTPFAEMSVETLIKTTHGKREKSALFNNAAQHWNHSFFWTCMKPGSSSLPEGLRSRLTRSFGGLEGFKQSFLDEGLAQFGSGWVWLVDAGQDRLEIVKTSNADNPMVLGKRPLLVCDVWEHAYYVDYQNRRAEYLKYFLDRLVDWEAVAERLLVEA